MLIGAGVRDYCGNSESKGDPAGDKCAEGGSPRKASALRSNQLPNLYKKKTEDKLDENRICLQSETTILPMVIFMII